MAIFEWLPSLVVGLTFAVLGGLKLYGVAYGIEGGREKQMIQYLSGT